PLFHGGPHAGFMAASEDCLRKLPGRIIGMSKDSAGNPALRMALQTREQHIRRDRATSNICTAQVLLAVAASMYAVYHGPERLRAIARKVHLQAGLLAGALSDLGHTLRHEAFFDTLRITPAKGDASKILARCERHGINLRLYPDGDLGVALDETVSEQDLRDLFVCFGGLEEGLDLESLSLFDLPPAMRRTSPFLEHPVFNSYSTEHEFLRYVKRLESRDLSLTTSMISLGSCTMKLSAAAQMLPISLPGFKDIHPFAPSGQTTGYRQLMRDLEEWLAEITGLDSCSLQPNAGSQGEYAGLLTIRAYHHSRGDDGRDVCLIPASAHGTNPASAVLAGMRVVTVRCDGQGNIDLADLEKQADTHRDRLAAVMVTYPSTHGVFEESIRRLCAVVHERGGQVYLDGANMNAMVGLCRPGDLGADVCHLNLHKTFAIPHGGGGPGVGPICTAKHLSPFLPGHPVVKTGGEQAVSAVSSAPFGSPGVLPITWAYITLLGAAGLKEATRSAILNANYVAHRLDPHFPVLYRGQHGRIAHECIVDVRDVSSSSGIDIDDVAKRLMDYGYHSPTMSFPVAGTLMIEPTESESLRELDRFCDALISIRAEIRDVEEDRFEAHASVLKGAPHTARAVTQDSWDRAYGRELAAYPSAWTREHKFWPAVGRVDNVLGDRQPCCSWLPDPGHAEE
ncbi:MAG: aminomethyl-transferring glycine dehydrogenase, partial [Planctomycetota bacterium]